MKAKKLNCKDDFIGKYYQLLNYDASLMMTFKINFFRKEEEIYYNEELKVNQELTSLNLSENGSSWYIYNDSSFVRIVDKPNLKVGEICDSLKEYLENQDFFKKI